MRFFRSSASTTTRLGPVAWHEAAHAIAAEAFGCPVVDVRIHDPLQAESRVAAAWPDVLDHRTSWARLVTIVAGPIGEVIYYADHRRPLAGGFGAVADDRKAADLAERVSASRGRLDSVSTLQANARQAAVQILQRNRAVHVGLAERLGTIGTYSRLDLAGMLDRVEGL